MNYLDEVKSKQAVAQQTAKEQQEQRAMHAELKKMQMASLMGSGKSTVILTDQTDLGKRFDEQNKLISQVIRVVQAVDHNALSTQQKQAVDEIKKLETCMEQAIKASQQAIEASIASQTSQIVSALKALKLTTNYSPEINLPEPKVAVTTQNVDFSELKDTIIQMAKENKPAEVEEVEPVTIVPDRFDLSRYTATDLKDGTDKQYVGYVNPEGCWYIIENDVKANKLRYVFGETGYSKHFSSASQWKYQILDKAIHAA